MGVSKNFPV